ncbi:hypothetical protein BH160DRAFT_4534 [Burkholderia sp. H160]|nr:hypothetical protein BH160DRAFT_4534 [Burkholderia sp. H160]
MDSFPTLTTSRLILWEVSPSDAQSLFAVHSDAEGMRWFGSDPMTDPVEAEKLIEVFAGWRRTGSGVRWVVERSADGVFLGTCGLFNWVFSAKDTNVKPVTGMAPIRTSCSLHCYGSISNVVENSFQYALTRQNRPTR